MLKTRLLVYFLMIAGPSLLAQSSLDSLKNKLATEKSDSVRFLILLRLSKESEFYDYAQSRTYAEQANELSTRLNTDWAKGKLFFRLAFLETMEGDYADALRYDLQCVKLYSDHKDSVRLARALNDVGTDYRDLGQYHESYFYLTQSYGIARRHRKAPDREDSLVMAIAMTVPDRALNTSSLRTTTGRDPSCSRPRTGVKSAQTTSPLSIRAIVRHPLRFLPPPSPVRALPPPARAGA